MKKQSDSWALISNSNHPEVSIIIPAYKLEEKIALTVARVSSFMDKTGLRYEIIVVDDGSPDGTWRKASDAFSSERIKALRYEINRGKGYALMHGFRHSRGDWIVFFDGDLDIHEEQIGVLLKALEDCDCVITSKWHPESRTMASPSRKILSWGFNLAVRLLTGIRLKDTQTGGKAFKRKILEEVSPLLTVRRYALDVELLAAITAKGYRIREVQALYPINLQKRFKLKEILRMLLDLLTIAYRKRIEGRYSGS
ncbi:MAG: glycosyltransferase family 2 protein [Candidatus Bathyarchaeia archaeon]